MSFASFHLFIFCGSCSLLRPSWRPTLNSLGFLVDLENDHIQNSLSRSTRASDFAISPASRESPSCCLAETSGTGCGVVTPSIGRYGRRHTNPALEDDAATTTTRPATRGPIALGLQSMRAGTPAALEPVLRRLPDHDDAGSQGRRHHGHHRDGARDAQGGPRLGVRPAHR